MSSYLQTIHMVTIRVRLDENGECIPIGQCKCQEDGLEFPGGYKEVRPGTHGLELCTCSSGLWKCKLATKEDIQSFPRANDLKAKCDNSLYVIQQTVKLNLRKFTRLQKLYVYNLRRRRTYNM